MREAAEGNDALLAVVEPMLLAWQTLREQVAVLDCRLIVRAKTDATAKRLMTAPGVVVALAYAAVTRKLAVLLHRLWSRSEDFRWPEPAAQPAGAA